MAVDMFLKLEGTIKGESKDEAYKDDIDILAWSWGMSQSGSFHTGGGGGAGKVNVQDISITKYIDASSCNLMQFCSDGTHFKEGKLVVRKAGKKPLEYYVIKMKDVLVTSISTGGSGGEDRLTENVTLNFAQCNVEYASQKEDGSGEPVKAYTWNVEANSPNTDI